MEGKIQKLGEYFLHLFIEETTSLECGGDETTDPMIKVSVMEEEKSSTQKKQIAFDTKLFWGEHFYFTKKYAVREDLEDDMLEIMVYDTSKLFMKSLIGSLKINLTSIYYETGHKFEHRWFIIQNRNKEVSTPTGFVKLSACLVGEGEDQVDLPLADFT